MKWLSFIGLLTVATALAQPIEVEDDSGRLVRLPGPAQRIVALAPHITELLFAAGAGDRVVGTTSYSDYPAAAKAIPVIGGYEQINFERLLALQPDLIIAWYSGNTAETIEKLGLLALPVYMSEPKSLAGISRNIRRFGQLAGTSTLAQSRAPAFDERRQRLRQANADKSPLGVFYQVWEDPLYTLGGGHFISDLFALCGGYNVFAGLDDPAPIVGVEAVISRNPQVMLTGNHHGERSLQQWKASWQRWPAIAAVANDQLFFVNQDLFTRSGPRSLDAAERLCEILDQARARYNGGPQVSPQAAP